MSFDYLKKARVLLVEDDEKVLSHMASGIEDFVAEVMTAVDGEKGLALYKEKGADLVVSDIKMPLMNGIEMISQIKSLPKPPKGTIITTAYGETEYFQDAIRLKVDRYILKPIDLKDLLDALCICMAPHVQKQRLSTQGDILSVITLLGGKKIKIIEYIISRLDNENIFYGTYKEIMDELDISKATVVDTFKTLSEADVLKRVQNGVYRFNKEVLLVNRGERYLKLL